MADRDRSGAAATDPSDWPTGRLLSTAARIVERRWDERLRELGLSHAAVVVLHHLATDGPTNPDTLARRVRVQPQTMSRTLDRMERDGTVERRPDDRDRRRRIVTITDAGRAAWASAHHLERSVMPEDERLRATLLEIIDEGRGPGVRE
ncbi:MarR family winged helix-turn-helix transcriptional regulator [Curtobacterium sp. RRHDQ10]|uniref:MarR family winged helix-turn-helix transcriptional regulator n=1 Tax=Curtobacterium phyllosphaerae TaxID=3413379 RepID=UPI003BF138C5